MMKKFFSLFEFDILHNLDLRVSKFLKTCFVQYSGSKDVYGHTAEPTEKQKRLSLLKVSLLGA